MFDSLSTEFSALQQETHEGVIGNPAFDRRTYAVLYGEDQTPRLDGRRRALTVVAVRVVLALIGLLILAMLV
jgi:hypothetical protein